MDQHNETGLPDDDRCHSTGPLDQAALEEFLRTKGRDLGRAFLTWAKHCSISCHDAKDAIQSFLLATVERIRAKEATAGDVEGKRVILCGKRDAIRNHLRSLRV